MTTSHVLIDDLMIVTIVDQDDSGMTVEGLQEWYDEACLVVYNNKYNDGVQWHDVPCFTRWLHLNIYQYIVMLREAFKKQMQKKHTDA